jgi:DNA-binding CsgD family transcriptional regulator
MSQHENRLPDSLFSSWTERTTPLSDAEIAELSAARTPAIGETVAAIARELNEPLTALLLYMGEIKLYSHRLSQTVEDRAYLLRIIDNALQQTERVCKLVGQLAGSGAQGSDASNSKDLGRDRSQDKSNDKSNDRAAEGIRAPQVVRVTAAGRKPLTRREREVLKLISDGHTNKQGAMRMRISPRTFESHRAEVMRKLGARNTADLVRAALLYPEVG